MAQLKRYAVAAAGGVIFTAVLALTSPVPTQGQVGRRPDDVRVINTVAEPVPTVAQGTTTVAGSVTIAGTPTVNVAGTPAVNVANTPTVSLASGASIGIDPSASTVTVGNAADDPVPTRNVNDAQQPFQREVILSFDPGENGVFVNFLVPTGKRLVIEHVSGILALTEGQKPFDTKLNVLQVAGGSVADHHLVATFQGTRPGIGDYFAISQPLRLYAIGSVRVASFRTDTIGGAQMNITVSGYLVDLAF